MIARLVRSADFERVLRTRTRFSSVHFAVHHLSGVPTSPPKRTQKPFPGQLSTGVMAAIVQVVDESSSDSPQRGFWWGAVVPKRHARRSVTRSLLKRQIRVAVSSRADLLSSGLWVVRLRAPFDRVRFVSAASDALLSEVREELERLLDSAVGRSPSGALAPLSIPGGPLS